MALEEITNKYLKVGKSTLYKKMARKSKVPVMKSANQWRFKKEDIDKWLQEIRNEEVLTNKEE